jgi:superfamily I DNA/RNA helicase
MLNRLAELVQRANPQITRGLRATYPFVFVDEFQDTSYAQYDFLQSVFGVYGVTVTAVGDDKQRIMGWAGAKVDAFQEFATDFGAIGIPFHFNFRSSPALVQLQQVVAHALDVDSVNVECQVEPDIDGDAAQIWIFDCIADEAKQLAKWISEDMETRGTEPKDYGLLVRQKPDEFAEALTGALANVGIAIRNEAKKVGRMVLQDLLVEPVAHILLAILRLAVRRKDPDAWVEATGAMVRIRGIDEDDVLACRKTSNELDTFIVQLREVLGSLGTSPNSVGSVVDLLVSFLNESALVQSYEQYGTGDNLAIALEAFKIHLANSCTQSADWTGAIERFINIGAIALMTVHKAKGLEFDTVVFLGLDDRSWWTHHAGNVEGLCTFFVALSRAKQRAIFTFCVERGQRYKVADLYKLLKTGGVNELSFRVSS